MRPHQIQCRVGAIVSQGSIARRSRQTAVTLIASALLAACNSPTPPPADGVDLASKLERLEADLAVEDPEIIAACMGQRGFDSIDQPPDSSGEAETSAFWKALTNDSGLEELSIAERKNIASDAIRGEFPSSFGCRSIAGFVRELRLTDLLGDGPEVRRDMPTEAELLADPVS